MPQVTVYVRQEDLETWKAIEKKSEFMHEALFHVQDSLSRHLHQIEETVKDNPDVLKNLLQPKTDWQEAGTKQEFVPKPPDPELGYPCCQKKSPCKHWHWDDIQMVWENELTGKIKADD